MLLRKYLQNTLVGGVAVLFGGTQLVPNAQANGPVLNSAISFVSGDTVSAKTPPVTPMVVGLSKVTTALDAFRNVVRPLSHPRALDDAFRSYFAYKSAHPNDVRKPYLYFVDYGLPSTTPRGYVFDMKSLAIVDGPFMVAHGRGSSSRKNGVPTRFSNVSGSAATSLGLYVAQETYAFHGETAGRSYGSLGLRLQGVSAGYNDNARARKVVAHGAPYVTPTKAGRSEGCPAMEQSRARRLLPELANGGMVFLFAPDPVWMAQDQWVASSAE
ncbi:MAG: murein L,D-transpeptidase catalytic domain-containing protein [Gemmatimonadales bacterium]